MRRQHRRARTHTRTHTHALTLAFAHTSLRPHARVHSCTHVQSSRTHTDRVTQSRWRVISRRISAHLGALGARGAPRVVAGSPLVAPPGATVYHIDADVAAAAVTRSSERRRQVSRRSEVAAGAVGALGVFSGSGGRCRGQRRAQHAQWMSEDSGFIKLWLSCVLVGWAVGRWWGREDGTESDAAS